jgi:hypothetical protein
MWQTDAQRSRYRIRYECRRSGPRHGPAAHLGELIDHVRDATGTMSFIHPSRKTVATTAGEDPRDACCRRPQVETDALVGTNPVEHRPRRVQHDLQIPPE